MAKYSASTLFQQNITSAEQCVTLYQAISSLNPSGVDVSWVLRAGVVFAVSSLDAYFHDKIRYRAGRYKIHTLPISLQDFPIALKDISEWSKYTKRPGNFIRNVLMKHFTVRPLQKKDDIAKALQLVGIDRLWATIEPHSPTRDEALRRLGEIVQRRNHIAHEGDRIHTRKAGKRLRPIDDAYVNDAIQLVKAVVFRIEHHYPN